MIASGKLLSWFYGERHGESVIVLIFNDAVRPSAFIRRERAGEYLALLPPEKEIDNPVDIG